MLSKLDQTLFYYINNFAGFSPALDWFFVFCAGPLVYIICVVPLILFGLTFYSYMPGRRRELGFLLMQILVSVVEGRLIIAELLRIIINRMRPFEVLGYLNQLVEQSPGTSFPSGHATFAFAVAGVIAIRYPKIAVPVLLAAVLVGFGRVAVGVHWPSDVLAGAFIGLDAALFTVLMFRFYEQKKLRAS